MSSSSSSIELNKIIHNSSPSNKSPKSANDTGFEYDFSQTYDSKYDYSRIMGDQQIQQQPYQRKNSNSGNTKESRIKLLISLAIGIVCGYFLFHLELNIRLHNVKNATDLYIKDYQSSDFYTRNPLLEGSNPFDHMVTYKRLIEAFPYREEDAKSANNKNIIQMWLKEDEIIGSKHKVDYMTNEENKLKDIPYEEHIPEVLETYKLLPHIILKSDLGRYFLLYLFGGVYADIDTLCQNPIDTWYDNVDTSKFDIGVTVSIEDDINRDDWMNSMPRRVELLQWAFKGNKRHHYWALLISKIVETTYRAKYEGKLAPWSSYQGSVDKCAGVNILDWTGPGVFTDAFVEYVNLIDGIEITDIEFEKSYGMKIFDEVRGPDTEVAKPDSAWVYTWKGLIALKGPRVINDLLVLPYAFEAPKTCDPVEDIGRLCYIHHSYSGVWKKDS
ncbi:hypothetical protein BVG19_g1929 [[Candida] boidinii]|nr:hypothetical protein BVG19_g1929 [[Candida] boidinii]OWB51598.1 hypothetical protein B5S27_g3163 [[Candida] boidinii]